MKTIGTVIPTPKMMLRLWLKSFSASSRLRLKSSCEACQLDSKSGEGCRDSRVAAVATFSTRVFASTSKTRGCMKDFDALIAMKVGRKLNRYVELVLMAWHNKARFEFVERAK